jgi:hypothetical protein
LVTNKSPANQRFEAVEGPCRTRTVAAEPEAAGERIVAFARPGKPLAGWFYGWIGRIPGRLGTPDFRGVRNGF